MVQGGGIVQVGKEKYKIKTWDTVYIPPETPHTVYSTINNQP
ncbi:MAG TPA: hypothetical protein ENF56_03120 [Candidatus Bathyarchaeota archaeon]|nr:hypothetical protein [Candidatus Bathyarchaeota archaeon]